MSKVECRGYCPAPSSEQQRQAFFESIPQLLEDAESILNDPVRFHSLPGDFCYCSWPYVAGDGPLCVGDLLLGWRAEVLVDHCAYCGNKLYLYSFAGSPLSGTNSFCGYCLHCKTGAKGRASGSEFRRRLAFLCKIKSDRAGETGSFRFSALAKSNLSSR